MSLLQSTVSMCLNARQIRNKKSYVIKTSRKMPQQLAVGVAIHQSIRSKGLVNMPHGFGMSVEYNRLLRVESQIEASVLKHMEQNNGLFLPANIVEGRHVFFAIDNVDFAEDTYDGRCTLHGTTKATYLKCDKDDKNPELRYCVVNVSANTFHDKINISFWEQGYCHSKNLGMRNFDATHKILIFPYVLLIKIK